MNPQQEQIIRLQARARGYDKAKEDAYVQFVKAKTEAAIQATKSAPPPQPEKKGDGFFKSLVKDPIKTLIVKPGTRIAQAGIGLYGSATGNQRAMDFAGQDISLDTPFGKYDIEAQKGGMAGFKQIAGDAAKTASYLVTPSRAVGAVKTGLTGAVKQGAVQGAKTGVLGGGLYSGGQAAQDNKSAGGIFMDTLKGAAIGGAAGGVLGGGVGALSTGLNKISRATGHGAKVPSKAVRDLEMKYEEIFTGTKPAKKAFEKSTTRGKTPARFLAEHGIIVQVKNGKIDSTNAITKIRDNAKPLNEVLQEILQAKDKQLPESAYIPLSKLRQSAKLALSNDRNKASGEFSKMLRYVDDVVDDLEAQFGKKVNYSTLNTIKQGQWDNAGFDLTKPKFSSTVHKKIGTAAKNTIEEVIEEADIQSLNSYIGDHYDAIANLEKITGNAVKGGRLGNYFGRTLGAIVGAKGGFLGSLAGAYAGDVVASILQNNYLATPIKRMMLQKLVQKAGIGSPQYKAALQALKQIEASVSQRLLPAGSAALKGNRNVMITPDVINLPAKLPDSIDKPFKGPGALSPK